MNEDEKSPTQGALPDTRTEEAKKKDYKIEEIIASFAPVNWQKKKKYRTFPIFDQDGSGSCVAQTGRKMLGVYTFLKGGGFVPLSAAHIYQRRANKPAGGMAGDDVFKIMQNGTTLEILAPGEKMTDTQMDAVKVSDFDVQVGRPFKIGAYLQVPVKDIETVASLIQETGKAVMVWFYFKNSEWTARPKVTDPNLDLYAPSTARHSVAAVDFTLTDDGKKALVIDDSWGPNAGNGAGQRIIDEDFYNARNWYTAHFMNFAFEDVEPEKPHYTFNRDLEFSANPTVADPDVVALQNILKYENLFPTNVESTGYFGAITKVAVGKFQEKYSIAMPADLGYGRVGPKTRAKLNAIYS